MEETGSPKVEEQSIVPPPEPVTSTEQQPEGAEEKQSIVNGDSQQAQPQQQAKPTSKDSEQSPKSKTKEKENSSDDDDEDDDGEILEESPCGRWLKRREQVKYRDVPGIDTAYLAMDTEEGVEVVWNEAQFSGSKKLKAQEDQLKAIFETLTHIDHPNIVNFHRYWTDHRTVDEKTGEKREPRLIFITEYMSSGSLKQFLRKTKKNQRKIPLQSWKRFCIQILSALNYLHTYDPKIVHGNLTCDTIFIQHNGLVKIGSVAPDIIHRNVKTCRDNIRNLHNLAPELGDDNVAPDTPVDIYAFGMCALESAALEISGSSTNGTGGEGGAESTITEEAILRTIDSLEDELQKDFIRSCLKTKPEDRPTARELLFHPILFEVHSLKLLAAHCLVNSPANINETMTDEAILTHYGKDTIMATLSKSDVGLIEYKLSDFPIGEKLEKFIEDVKFGIYPITAFPIPAPARQKTRTVTSSSESEPESRKSKDAVLWEAEVRAASSFGAHIGPAVPADPETITVFIRLVDSTNRQVSCPLSRSDTPEILANELVFYGFISQRDRDEMVAALTRVFVQRANEVGEYYAERMVAAGNASADAPLPDMSHIVSKDPLKLHFQQPIQPGNSGDSDQEKISDGSGQAGQDPGDRDHSTRQQQQQQQQQQVVLENGIQNLNLDSQR